MLKTGDYAVTNDMPEAHWQEVSVGAVHTVARQSNGTLWTWGQNDYGQLGDGTQTDRLISVPVVSVP